MPPYLLITLLILTLLHTSLLNVTALSFSYFAYGSNLNKDILEKRTLSPPSSLPPPRPAILKDYILAINLGTAASVEKCAGGECEGLVYELPPRAFALLCASEGVPAAYKLEVVDVTDWEGKEVKAFAFVSGRGLVRGKTTKR